MAAPSAAFQVGTSVRLDQINKALSLVQAASADLTPFFRQVDKDLTDMLNKQFATQGHFFGTPWDTLKSLTVRLRSRTVKAGKKYGGYKSLVDRQVNRRGQARAGLTTVLRNTNTLWASLGKHTGPSHLKIFQPLYYARGTLVDYARFHQTGWVSRKVFRVRRLHPVRIPARPIVPEAGLPPTIIATWERRGVDYITTGNLR